MDVAIPIWRVPHRFVRAATARPVLTVGLLTLELSQLRIPKGVRALGSRVGYEWLAATADRLTGTESTLGHYLEPRLGTVRGQPLELRPFEVPDDVVAEFAATGGVATASWAANAFNGLDLKLAELGRSRTRIPAGYTNAARQRLAALEPPIVFKPREVVDASGRRFWTLPYRDLVERAALELFDLATRRPQVRLCTRCGRPFIPVARRGETGCPNNLWDAGTLRPIALCAAKPAATPQRERERKRLHQNWHRAFARHRDNPNHPAVRKAEQEWLDWKQQNPPPRKPGRPETPYELPPSYATDDSDQRLD